MPLHSTSVELLSRQLDIQNASLLLCLQSSLLQLPCDVVYHLCGLSDENLDEILRKANSRK